MTNSLYIEEIENISKIYANGNGADKEKSRGITAEDVNKIIGVVADGNTITPEGINEYENRGFVKYGTQFTDHSKGTSDGWTPSAWINATSEERADVTNAPGFTGKTSGYYYSGTSSNLKTADTSSIRYELIFSEIGTLSYRLASKGILTIDPGNGVVIGGSVLYGSSAVEEEEVYVCIMGFTSTGTSYGCSINVRPVVYLKADTILKQVSIREDGVATWDISNY